MKKETAGVIADLYAMVTYQKPNNSGMIMDEDLLELMHNVLIKFIELGADGLFEAIDDTFEARELEDNLENDLFVFSETYMKYLVEKCIDIDDVGDTRPMDWWIDINDTSRKKIEDSLNYFLSCIKDISYINSQTPDIGSVRELVRAIKAVMSVYDCNHFDKIPSEILKPKIEDVLKSTSALLRAVIIGMTFTD